MEQLIAKEEIGNFRIVPAPEDHSQELSKKMEDALRLGNGYKGKANITFQTEAGPKKVETTVWAVDEHFLQLKNGIIIPSRSLIDIVL
ncbi:hypothetical protein [Pedobacter sp. SYSU D00535]|uniref:hypothetical protein n=1 Tax=Pedobacter sp. SYSU D00535 TaxID=2810308 RepID=UPI001A977CAE|nr:hypothetical protein [Pedobacter sp. SYSU D00535]